MSNIQIIGEKGRLVSLNVGGINVPVIPFNKIGEFEGPFRHAICLAHIPTFEQIEELDSTGWDFARTIFIQAPELKMGQRTIFAEDFAAALYRWNTKQIWIQGESGFISKTFNLLTSTYFHEITMLVAHSDRVSVDETQPDGSVKKTAVFKHVAFEFVQFEV
jgi:hypothetical protein